MSSILKVDQLQDSGGNEIITSNGSGTITVNSQPFKNGITEADQWRITASHSGIGDLTANWERVDNTGFNYIGTGMTQSSGVFTFPSTGIYLVKFNSMVRITSGDSTYISSRIKITVDNSSYNDVSYNYASLVNGAYGNAECNFVFDVTDTSTHKVKFSLAQNQNGTPLLIGYTDANQTYGTFIKLGNT